MMNKPDYHLELAKRIARHLPPAHLVDFHLRHEGSIVLLNPISPRAVEWVSEFIGQDNGYQPLYPSVLIESRFLEPILQGIADAGLVVG